MEETTDMPEVSPATATAARLTPAEAGERLAAAPQTLARWRWVGIGPPYLKLNGKIFYLLSDIESYLQSCRIIPTKKTKPRSAKKPSRAAKGKR